MGTTDSAAAAVRLLEAGVAALSDVDLEALSDGQQLALLRVLHPLMCRMEAQRSRVIGSVHRRGAVFADGAVSTVAWLRSRLRMSDGHAQLRVAAAVREVPELSVAYAAGQVSYAQVSVVAPVVPDIAPEVLAAGAGKLLAEQAIQLAPGPLRQVAARIRDHFDPDGGELLLTTLTALMPPTGGARPAQPGAPARRRPAGPVPAGRQPGPDRGWGESPRHRRHRLADPAGQRDSQPRLRCADHRGNRPAAGLRRHDHPGGARHRGRAAGPGSGSPAGQHRPTPRPRPARQRLPLPRLRPPSTMDRRPPPDALGPRRPHRLGQPAAALPVAPHRRPRRRLDPPPRDPHQHGHRNQARRPTPRHHQPAEKPLTRPLTPWFVTFSHWYVHAS